RARGFAPRPCPKISQRSSGLASLPARRLRRVPKPEGTHTPPTPHGGKVDDPRQRTPQPRRPSTADPTLPYPTDRTRRSRDGHLSRVRVEVGESMATTWRFRAARSILDATSESQRDAGMGRQADRNLSP